MGPLELLTPEPARRFGGPPARNAWVEMHNLIAAAESPSEFGPSDLERIGRRHGIDLHHSFLDERIGLYGKILDWVMSDGDFTAGDRRLAAHVATTLDLGPADLRDAHERAFGKAVSGALADDCLDVEERLLLYTLQHTLGLDPEVADGAFEVMARERLLLVVARILCDGEFSPEEAGEVERLAEALDLELPARVQTLLEKAAHRWALSHGTLPAVDVGVPLRKNERGHFVAVASWRAVAAAGLRRTLSTPSARDALATGRSATIQVPNASFDGDAVQGQVVVTSRRLLFDPDDGEPHYHALDSVKRSLLFANGVAVETSGGRTVFVDAGTESASLHEVIGHALHPEKALTFEARWRPFLAEERDVALSKVARRIPLEKRRDVALRYVLTLKGWSRSGQVDIERDKVRLNQPGGQRTISLRTIRGLYAAGRLVWMARAHAHDWILEFGDEEAAQRFVRHLLHR